MSVIEIDTAMKHCRAEDDDLELVQAYLDAAEDQAARFMGRRFYADADSLAAAELEETAGDCPMVINPSITAACLLITGHLFAHREDVIIGTITANLPKGSEYLLFPYRVGMGV